ncbi:transglycosylase SLT domain-containing protein [Candidatus Woesebacteria bacterium]|nr:transglycosylase SLT domain-containing protein [Candidatus Woesebacteria bacterium]
MASDKQKNPPKDLEKLKHRLIAQREALKEELSSKYPEVYNYLVGRGIDLNNLQIYSKNIAAALIIANQVINLSPPKFATPQPTLQTQTSSDNPVSTASIQDVAKDIWKKYGSFIVETARKYNLDARVIFATIMTESEGNPKAYRYEPQLAEASYGLGQLLYSSAVSLGFHGRADDLFNPLVNIDLIARYHKRTIDTYGNVSTDQLVRAYNAGDINAAPHPGHMERFWMWYNSYQEDSSTSK